MAEAKADPSPPLAGDERVLLLAPTGRDAELLCDQLSRRGFAVCVCRDLPDLCEQINRDGGAAFVAEEALIDAQALGCLVTCLNRQPPWSDIPVIVMTESGDMTPQSQRLGAVFRTTGNVTLLQRPIRLFTLFSVMDSALKSRRRQYQVRRLLDDTRKAVEQRDQFLAMLGHELRNPLAAIVNAVSILKQFGKSDAQLSTEQHDVIGRQSSHMARLVDDLLDVARITSGKIVLNVQPLDLRDVTGRALQTFKLMGARQLHEVSFDSPGKPIVIRGDPVRLEQVMTNLLTNAMKYTPAGGKIRVSVGRDHQAIVRVQDTGDGVPADMLDRIFEPFTQVSPNLARSAGGLGMGLTVVKSLIEMHGGTVTARSGGPGKGTDFEVRLPLARAAVHERQASKVRPTVHPCDILVVEDNADSRKTLARLLQLYGHKVEVAEDGPSGLETALRRRPEVVLLDIGLPGMDGYEVGRRIRKELAAGVFLIALTGYGQPEDREHVRDAGFDLHLVKPIDPEKLNGILAARLPAERAEHNERAAPCPEGPNSEFTPEK